MLTVGAAQYLLTRSAVTDIVGDSIQPIPAPVKKELYPCITYQSPSGQIDVGATGLSLEVRHDQLVNEDAAAEAKKNASEASSKADKDRLRAMEEAFEKQKILFGMSLSQEATFWNLKLHAFKSGTAEYLEVLQKYGHAAEAESKRITGIMRTTILGNVPAVGLTLIDKGQDQLAMATARATEQQAVLQASLVETRARIDLSTGAISANAAALLVQSAHVGEYQAKFAALNKELSELKGSTLYGLDGSTLGNL
jgi:hypothetical protein